MRFELFDRDTAAVAPAPEGPLVHVQRGRVLFNRPAWHFLAMQGAALGLALAFDVETRTVAVRPVVDADPSGARWSVEMMRSVGWPVGVPARVFLEHYRVADGEYRAWLLRGPGPRMVTFEVAAVRPEVPVADGEQDAGTGS